MRFIPLLFPLVAFFAALLRSPERAFLRIYLPVLLIFPQFFTVEVKGFPDLTVGQWTIIPIVLLAGLFRLYRWSFSGMDLFILFYTFCCVYSEYSTSGFGLGRNLLATMLCAVVFPYGMAKMLVQPSAKTVLFIRRFVFLVFISVLLSLYELRFVYNPFIGVFREMFPGQGYDWPALFRLGLVRVGGPYAQPILFGIIIGLAMLFHYWLIRNRFWERNFRYFPSLPLSKATLMMGGLGFGLLMTVSRGPLLSTFLGSLFLGVGYTRSRMRTFVLRFTVLIAAVFVVYQTYLYYLQIDKYLADSEMAGNVAYRGEITREYTALALKKPIWGWGSTNWPVLPGIKSVDNQYLWLFLKHGYMGLLSFLGLLFFIMLRLFYRGIVVPKTQRADSSLSFTYLGAIVAVSTSLITVYLGQQIESIFFMILGVAEGFLCSRFGAVTRDPTTRIAEGKK